MTYKQLKEDFVSGLSGGEVSEINYVTAIGPVAIVLWSVLQSRQSFFAAPSRPLSLVVDFLLNVVCPLLAITLYADSPLLLAGCVLGPAALVYALPAARSPPLASRRKKPKLSPPQKKENNKKKDDDAPSSTQLPLLPPKPFLTTYRGSMLVLTCLAILAVDFRLFPRRFAKVETWGTSLMDVGVGSFVFSAGLVAARPVLKERAEAEANRGTTATATTTLLRRLLQSMRHALPLLLLGVVRLVSVKGLDYNEHVTEYGVHWNFFFTLGFLPPFVALAQQPLLRLAPRRSGGGAAALLALLIAVAYQVALESTGLKAYVLTAPRAGGWFAMNREGVCSFWGYLAIFLAGQDTGMYVLPRAQGRAKPGGGGGSRKNNQYPLLLTLAAWTAVWSALYVVHTNPVWGAGLDVSRRLANLPYVLWIAAFNTAQLLAMSVIDAVFFPSASPSAAPLPEPAAADAEREAYEAATSPVLRAFNRNGLAVFLAANLLTGLVNLTVPTLDVGPAATMAILVGYAAVLTAAAVALDRWDVSIKL
ncbi:Glucosaminyl phosphatidylinositol (GlcN-PI) nositol acylation protein [Diatrype stigma]|uniref:GPI-anchored wall transfer protein n=1 Tax=Diatrype stigma TaxID=117547 RepID=A0AAN9YU43_9PEZI